jgi:ribosomal-protein-alanine N-acetyltransferase
MEAAAPCSLRPLAEDDLAQVVEIERRNHVAPWSEASFRAEIEKPYARAWVLTDDETDSQIFGYLVMHFLFEDAQILNVVVDLPYRGMGYAQRMIRQGVQEALRRDLKRMTLEVRKGNLSAVQLYQKLGFTITQVRRGYYSNGEDAYLMTLELVGDRVDF